MPLSFQASITTVIGTTDTQCVSWPGAFFILEFALAPGWTIWDIASFVAAGAMVLLVIVAGGLAYLAYSAQRKLRTAAETSQRSLLEQERRRLAQHTSEAQLQNIINSAQDAILTVNEKQQITIFNKAAEEMFRCKAEDALGKPLDRFIPTRFRPVHGQHIKDFGATGVTSRSMGHQRVLAAVRADGAEFPMEATISQATVDGQKFFTAIVRDVTARIRADEERTRLLEAEQKARAAAEEAERKAQEANRAKDEFLATLSHELRTPLTAILGWVRLIRGGKLSTDQFERGLTVIERNTKAQAELIEDLLDISRVISGKMLLDTRPVELARVVEAAIDVIRPTAEAKQLHLHFGNTLGPRRVLGDPHRLQQIIWNLLSNAAKFTPREGCIGVTLSERDEYAEFSIYDSGRGITPEFLPRLFERFSQADSTTTRKFGGLGIGLALVRHLVEAHGGSVRAESAGEGKGAAFTVLLPLIPRQLEAAAEKRAPFVFRSASPGEHMLDGLHVLVVEDEPDALELIAMVLQRSGARVTAVMTAAEALQVIERLQPDVVISDIAMPDQDGFDLIRELRRRGHRIPAAALTAFAKDEDRARALSAGFQVHLSKPVEPEELTTEVARLAHRN